MPTVTIDIVKVDKLPGQRRVVEIEAKQGDNRIIRTISLDDFATWTDFAAWLINQQPDRTNQEDWRRRLVVTFQAVTDPETGATTRTVETVNVQALP